MQLPGRSNRVAGRLWTNCFDFVVTSEEAGVEKPAPEPFELALEKLSALPENTWIIGDNQVTDIEGGKNLKMTVLQKCHEGVDVRSDENGPDLVFNDFSILHRFMQRKGWIID